MSLFLANQDKQITKEVIVEKFSVNSQELINKVKKEEEKMNISCEEDENEICDDEEDDDFSLKNFVKIA